MKKRSVFVVKRKRENSAKRKSADVRKKKIEELQKNSKKSD